MTTQEILIQAKESKTALMLADAGRRNTALLKMADALVKPEHMARILEANRRDLEAARGTISDVMLDRLMLDEARIAGMAQGIREVAGLEAGWQSAIRNRASKWNDHSKEIRSNGRHCNHL